MQGLFYFMLDLKTSCVKIRLPQHIIVRLMRQCSSIFSISLFNSLLVLKAWGTLLFFQQGKLTGFFLSLSVEALHPLVSHENVDARVITA
jgi:hypothetical protein